MVKYVIDNRDLTPELDQSVEEIVAELYRPVRTWLEHKDYTTNVDVNPYYITPKMLQLRLQKLMDEYVAGISTGYQTNSVMLEIAERKLQMLREDAMKMCARDLHELLRAWENRHRIMTAWAHLKHIQFREETRYPGYYYRSDFRAVDDGNWKCFVNSSYNRHTEKWSLKKVKWQSLIAFDPEQEPEGVAHEGPDLAG